MHGEIIRSEQMRGLGKVGLGWVMQTIACGSDGIQSSSPSSMSPAHKSKLSVQTDHHRLTVLYRVDPLVRFRSTFGSSALLCWAALC
jgi:hypothetical protein